jgi:pyrroloquinoline quinone (PQQ) biosynthesis protein C
VVKHANSEELRQKVRDALDQSLTAWWSFFDGIERSLA